MAERQDLFKIQLIKPLSATSISACETCIYGTPLFCPESDWTRIIYSPQTRYLEIQQTFGDFEEFDSKMEEAHLQRSDGLINGTPEHIEYVMECSSRVEDPRFRGSNQD